MVEELKSNKMYGGFNTRYQHDSKACGCKMTFTVFFPPAAATEKVPVIYYLSGLTCTDENVIQKVLPADMLTALSPHRPNPSPALRN